MEKSGIYSAVSINVPASAALTWAVTSMQGNFDLFWDHFSSLFASADYVLDLGIVAIPVLADRPFEIVGVDASTGLQAFSRVYDPLPPSDPGTAAPIDTPNVDRQGPYPVFATPFRIETVDLQAEGEDITSIRDFTLRLENNRLSVTTTLSEDLGVTLLDVTRGTMTTRAHGLDLAAGLGDHVVLLVDQKDIDPDSQLSVVFSEPIDLGGANDPDQVEAQLRTLFKLEVGSSRIRRSIWALVTGTTHFSTDSAFAACAPRSSSPETRHDVPV